MLTERVFDSHLAGLRRDSVSYIFAGERELDLGLALEILNRELGIERLLLEGGGGSNGSFLRAGLIDEISIAICPAVDGAKGAPSIFDSGDQDAGVAAPIRSMTLMSSEVLEGGVGLAALSAAERLIQYDRAAILRAWEAREAIMQRLGIAFSGGPSPAEIVDCIVLAESVGYELAWVAEGHGGDQFAILAAAAARTSRIRLGTSITSVFVRTAPTIAMAAAAVDDISGGRFILGIGSSHKVQVEAEHGVSYAKPLTRVRETVAVIRDLLREGRVQFQGETVKIDNFDLWFTPPAAAAPGLCLGGVFENDRALRGDRRRRHADPQHARHRRPCPRAAR